MTHPDEGRLRAQYGELARRAIDRAVDPASKDFLNFTRDRQPLVDAAFLAHGVLRAPRALGDELDAGVKRHLVTALECQLGERAAREAGAADHQELHVSPPVDWRSQG